jgi:hypothetical protein
MSAIRQSQLIKLLVGVRGFEPPTPSSRTMCATRLRYTPTPRPIQGSKRVYKGVGHAAQALLRGPPSGCEDRQFFPLERSNEKLESLYQSD